MPIKIYIKNNNSISFYFRAFLDILKILEINLLVSGQTWSFYWFFLVCCNTSNLRGFCLFDGGLLGIFWYFFFYCSVLVFIFLLLTLHRKSQIHDNIMMPVQCGICVLFPVVEIPPVWRGTEQFFTHNINNRVNKRKYWIESIISSCPLTFRLIYPMLKWCRRAGTTLQVFRTLLVHIWDVLSNSALEAT